MTDKATLDSMKRLMKQYTVVAASATELQRRGECRPFILIGKSIYITESVGTYLDNAVYSTSNHHPRIT